jgi:class 3 adenylate cyclase/tetratricopeptide (TPR) repeat protein
MIICAACGAQNREGARFCDSCGSPIAEATEAREERKVVTALFADVVGFTGRAEQLDPEDVRAMLTPYYALLRSELERHGGTVEKFIGDAVMALFGAPVAHEDDPERAVRAALAIRDAIAEQNAAQPGLALQVRIGISTGEALITLDARPSDGEGMAAGDVVNTAARLQAAAPVDGILVGEATYRATRDQIVYREAEPVQAKGKSGPVVVWEAVEARARFGVDISHLGPQLVGRRDEVDLLRDALARVRRDRSPQLVTLVGVPGIGKSRLVFELFDVVDEDPDLIYWRQGRCLPYGQGVTFWAVGEMVKAQAGILETDRTRVVAEKLREVLEATLPDPGELEWLQGHLRPLVGLAAEEELGHGDRNEAFAAWRRFFESVAEQGPLVLVFEDLHWADDGVLDFVDYLVDWAGDVPLLVVCTARPELLERRPGWGGGKRNAATVSLAPLSEEDTARLVASLLEQSVLPAEVQTALLEHAGGNPLYAEEYVRMLLDRGFLRRDGAALRLERADELPLPETVQGILAARLDALSTEEKALLQDAAVIGKVFWVGALEAVGGEKRWTLEERLHGLERKEFVRRERRSSVASENEFAFRHVLVRDAAYAQLPRARRSERHRAAAEWIESLAGDRAEDKAEMLAHHYLAALEFAPAGDGGAGSLAHKARLALREAGQRADALNSPGAAVRFYRAALEFWPADDPDRSRLLREYGAALFDFEQGGEAELEEACEGLLALGDPEAASGTQVTLGILAWGRGDQRGTFVRMERAVELVESRPPSRAKAFAIASLASKHMTASNDDEAIRLSGEALQLYESLGDEQGVAESLNTRGVARASSGESEGGLRDLERSVELGRRLNNPRALGRAANNLASVLQTYGDLSSRNLGLLEESARAWRRAGSHMMSTWLPIEIGVELYLRGEWDEALARFDAFIEQGASVHYAEISVRSFRGRIRVARGEIVAGLADSLRAVELAREARDPQVFYPSLASASLCLFDGGRPQEGVNLAREVLAHWRDQGLPYVPSLWSVDVAFVLGEDADLIGALGEARVTRWRESALQIASGDLDAAASSLASIGAVNDVAYCRLRAAEGRVAAGRAIEPAADFQEAVSFFRRVRATAYLERCELLRAA